MDQMYEFAEGKLVFNVSILMHENMTLFKLIRAAP